MNSLWSKNKPPDGAHRRVALRQSIYKPGSVEVLAYLGRSFLYEHGHPCPLAAYPRCLHRGGHLSPHIWPCSNRGLPSHSCHHECGGLLLHLFTLTTEVAVCSLWHYPSPRELALSVPRCYLAVRPTEPGLSSDLVIKYY
jgi:hypothetical protein